VIAPEAANPGPYGTCSNTRPLGLTPLMTATSLLLLCYFFATSLLLLCYFSAEP
jgi:hypothetical protein